MEQINSRGQALEEGLDVFISAPFLSDEYLSFNNSFITSTLSAANIVTSNSGYAISAVSSVGLPTYSNSNWYRFSSNAEAFAFSLDNKIVLPVLNSGGESSISGIFQELKQLVKGCEYEVTINFHDSTNAGTVGVSRLYNSSFRPFSLSQSSVTSYTLPTSKITLNFKAYGTSDVLFIEFTSSNTLSVSISSISVKKKDYYKLPVVADLIGSGLAKVLRRKFDSSIPLEEGQPPY